MSRFIKIFLQIPAILILSAGMASAVVEDKLVNSTLTSAPVEKPYVNLNYNYDDTDVVDIKLFITENVKNEKYLYEGQILQFRVAEDVKYKNNIIIKKDTPVSARVETIIENGMNGIPASVVLGNFKIAGVSQAKITSTYEKFGLDLSLLVFPLKWALTILPPTGSFTNFIKGGHVKFKTKKAITIQYHPNW